MHNFRPCWTARARHSGDFLIPWDRQLDHLLFDRTPITLARLSTMLDRTTRGIPADFLDPLGSQLNHLYLIVNAVVGLDPGAYVFHRGRKVLELLKHGEFRARAWLPGIAAEPFPPTPLSMCFLADLEPHSATLWQSRISPVQLEAGILGGRLYLAAYAQHLGASSRLTFFDDDVTQFFSPHAEGKSAIFLVALGHSAKARP